MAIKAICQIPAQVAIKKIDKDDTRLKAWIIGCKRGYNSVVPYNPPPEVLPSTAQDTLWGDIKTKLLPRIVYSFTADEHYRKQSDFYLKLEYTGPDNLFSSTNPPVRWKTVIESVKVFDNVLIEEYEVEEHKFWKGNIKKIYHRIVQIGPSPLPAV